jgi:hypothetical protein
MALIVGTNTYVDEATAAQYCSDFGLNTLADAENSLKQATVAIDRLYGGRWIGHKEQTTQPLAWPRILETDNDIYVIDADGEWRDVNGIQPEVEQATVELAVLIENGFDPYEQPAGGVVSESTQVAGAISTSVTYSSTYKQARMFKIDLILRPLLITRGSIAIKR